MNIQEEIQKELAKIKCSEGLTIDTILLNSDLGRKVVENLIKRLATPDSVRPELWRMAKVITDRQKVAKENPEGNVDWDMLEEDWFDWLVEELFGNDD